MPSQAMQDLIDALRDRQKASASQAPPTLAERAPHSLSNDEIAGAMVLSPATVKTHVSRAMIKLGARDRAQLVVFAYQAGLITPRGVG
jgi:DNA-binding NarL/FixJ family response regulator